MTLFTDLNLIYELYHRQLNGFVTLSLTFVCDSGGTDPEKIRFPVTFSNVKPFAGDSVAKCEGI